MIASAIFHRFFLFLPLLLLPLNTASAESGGAMTQKDVEEIVRGYLNEHPEVIIEAIKKMQARQEAAEAERVAQTIIKRHKELVIDPSTPIGGNPRGNVTVVEFFDYQCGHCRRVQPIVQDFVKQDGNVKVAFKELPLMGPLSIEAAKTGLAVHKLDPAKYSQFHAHLMSSGSNLSQETIEKAVGKTGLDPADVATAKEDPAIIAALRKNMNLAHSLGINGTPSFVIGRELIPGALDSKTLEQLVTEARMTTKDFHADVVRATKSEAN